MINFLILFLISTIFAQEVVQYEVSNKKTNFYKDDELRILATEKCSPSKNQKDCKNFEFLKKVSIKKLGKPREGNPNPGSLICEEQLSGKIAMGYDSSQNQISFCRLSNGSLIDNGTLSYYGSKNDGFVRKKRRVVN